MDGATSRFVGYAFDCVGAGHLIPFVTLKLDRLILLVVMLQLARHSHCVIEAGVAARDTAHGRRARPAAILLAYADRSALEYPIPRFAFILYQIAGIISSFALGGESFDETMFGHQGWLASHLCEKVGDYTQFLRLNSKHLP